MNNIIKFEKENLLKEVQNLIGKDNRTLYVIDKNLYSIYHNIFDELDESQFIIFESSEENKNIENVQMIYDKLIDENYNRQDYLIAVGGGITGDLCGFVAATYMRGMNYINIPTSLLAMVDSSIGGKSGFNYHNLKNMIGAFYEAEHILIDFSFLDTLPKIELQTGMAEVIKTAMIFDDEFFYMLENYNKDNLIEGLDDILKHAQFIKFKVVESDMQDRNRRNALNFGHSIGHAIEALCFEKHLKISHGFAISMGMAEIMKVTLNKGLCTKETHDRLIAMLKSFGLPHSLTLDKKDIFDYIKLDKKKRGSINKLIVSYAIGTHKILELNDEELKEFLEIE